MSTNGLHVVFGTGQVGSALIAELARSGNEVRAVSLHHPIALPEGVDWRAADVTDPEAAADAAKGASVVYQCLNAPYTKWPELFPTLQRGVLAAAERAEALLVTLENVYGYGPTGGKPMTEDHSLAATTVKGRTRASMTMELLTAADAGRLRIAIGRASDFFGAGVTESALGERVFANAVAGKRADFIGNVDLLHTYSYVPDIAAGLATLGTDERAIGGVWHLPGPETASTRAVLVLVDGEVGTRWASAMCRRSPCARSRSSTPGSFARSERPSIHSLRQRAPRTPPSHGCSAPHQASERPRCCSRWTRAEEHSRTSPRTRRGLGLADDRSARVILRYLHLGST